MTGENNGITRLVMERSYIRNYLYHEDMPAFRLVEILEAELARVRLLLYALRDGNNTPEMHCKPLDPMSSHRYVVDKALEL